MRTAAFLILAYLVIGLQMSIAVFAVRGVAPNLLLPVVVFVALHLPRQPAVLGSFFAGLLQDLSSMQPLGLYAVSYGLSALVISHAADGVRRGHILTWLAMTLVAGGITGTLVLLHDLLRSSVDGIRTGPRVVLVSVLFSTAISPGIIWLLRIGHRMLGPDPGRRGHRV